MRISKKQLDGLAKVEQQKLVECLVRRFSEELPADSEVRADVRGFVTYAVELAVGYGVEREHEVIEYVELAIPFRDEFGLEPSSQWMDAVMADNQQSVPERLATLENQLEQLRAIVDEQAEQIFLEALLRATMNE